MMTIEDPVGYEGDTVLVLNYRMKPPRWEAGEIRDLHYRPARDVPIIHGGTHHRPGRWAYDVWITRPLTTGRWGRPRGGDYAIQVSGDSVRALAKGGS